MNHIILSTIIVLSSAAAAHAGTTSTTTVTHSTSAPASAPVHVTATPTPTPIARGSTSLPFTQNHFQLGETAVHTAPPIYTGPGTKSLNVGVLPNEPKKIHIPFNNCGGRPCFPED
jgi:hypothetical protein